MTETITVQGLATRHHIEGAADATPVLMLHGWGANIDLMQPLAQRLAPHGYRVYIPDMPGFGGTAQPPNAWTVYDYAHFVLSYLDQQQLERVHLFGHSFGGRLSLILGAEHPERLHKIVLADSAGVRPQTPFTTQARLTVYKGLRDGLRTIGLKPVADALQGWYNNRYGSSDYKNVSGVMRETFVNVVNEDLLPYAARVKPSTLLLWGSRDEDTPLEQGQILEKTIPDAGLVVFEGAGHYSYLDKLADAVRVIDYFYKH